MVRFEVPAISEFCVALGRAQGMSEGDARAVVEIMVQCDARGIRSHGLMRWPTYLRRMQAGGIDPRARPEVIKESGATAVVDARNASGYVASRFAMEHAIGLARKYGVSAVAERN
ncbi:MAG: Ldh family oxidoreductase, partial [Candidatus Eremiobacteraeota bacterium]|nr:Ldh family oxidoreductase [Candidatus Eremiobacteraeota bacterium]MBV8355158.1 Ldh family oxidoreductase [Candidatus Eremiobacteraeota bacterium]